MARSHRRPHLSLPSFPIKGAGTVRRAFLFVLCVSGLSAGAAARGRVGPDFLYPSATLTPGRADTLSAAELSARYSEHCRKGKLDCTYAQSHRSVPAAVHRRVYEEYAVPAAARNGRDGEVDHFYPVCAGGSNDIANLWYQPADRTWRGHALGYHEKDVLEAWVCREIKAGRLDPAVAYERMTRDWVAWYLAVTAARGAAGG
jgi:hypothetical protein